MANVTQVLVEWANGDGAALERLVPLVYPELRRIARGRLRRERPDHTLDPTVLVHEAYLRLVGAQVEWRNREHFFAGMARLMGQILIDHARRHGAAKRGGSLGTLPMDEEPAVAPDADWQGLHEALERLARHDPEQARVVELRYFGGFTIEETAEMLERSPATIKREWSMARAWLRRELSAAAP